MKKINFYIPYVIIALLVFLANGSIFLISNPLWDDWSLTAFSFEELNEQFIGNGFSVFGIGHFHYILSYLASESILYIRLLTLLLYFLNAIILYRIFTTFFLDNTTSWFLIALAIFNPLMFGLFPQIDMPYLICLFLFQLGFYLYHLWLQDNRHNALLILAFILLSISFITNSLLFFVIPLTVIHAFFIFKKYGKDYTKRLAVGLSSVVLAVVVFYLFKSQFVQVSGAYQDYNRITFDGLIFSGIKGIFIFIYASLLAFYKLQLTIFSDYYSVILFGLFCLVFSFLFLAKSLELHSNRKNAISFFVGLCLFLAGIYPYAVVGKLGYDFLSFNQRHNLLTFMGFAVMLYHAILLFPSGLKVKKYILISLLSVFAVNRCYIGLQYAYASEIRDNYMNQVSYTSDDEKAKSILYIVDNDFSRDYHKWRFYEFGGMLRANNLPQNKVYLPKGSEFLNKNSSDFEDIEKFNDLFLSKTHYGLLDFDKSNYIVEKVSFHIPQESISFYEVVTKMNGSKEAYIDHIIQ